MSSLVRFFDQRRDLVVPGDAEATVQWSVEHFIEWARESIAARGHFAVALSGGSTPKKIFQGVTSPANRERIDWSRVYLFWSDERSVPPDHPDSNYRMAMDAGFAKQPIPPEQIFRMEAEGDAIAGAAHYEEILKQHLPDQTFDLMMLGMGDDGHVASLFPHTHGLQVKNRNVTANYIPDKHTWRMSLTFEGIHQSHCIALYVLGASKAKRLAEVLQSPYNPIALPAQGVGTPEHKALWILDTEAARDLIFDASSRD